MRHAIHACTLAVATLALLGACTPRPGADPEGATMADTVVRGTVTYRERMALPPGAEVEVWITDVSPGPVIQSLVAQATVRTDGRQVPIAFELPFDRARIDSTHDYAVHAVIKDASGPLFRTASPVRVITNGAPMRVELVLVREGDGGGGAAGGEVLAGSAWRLVGIEGRDALAGAEATLEFPEPGRAGGRGSCNRWFGSVAISREALTFSQVGSTKMACMQEGVMEQETRFFAGLERSARFEIRGDTLLVHPRDGGKPLRFTRIAR